jgi:OmpA-OmpF porin, OOP family
MRHALPLVSQRHCASLRSNIFAAALAALPLLAAATEVPTADLKGLTDPPGLKRYTGAVLVYRDEVAYDEIKFPSGKVRDVAEAYPALSRAGKRVALQYTLPNSRSALEVVRNYQQQAGGEGFQTVFECVGDACGSGSALVSASIVGAILPNNFAAQVGDNSPAACGAYHVSPIRYALFENKTSGATLAVAAATPDISSANCTGAFNKQTTVWVVRVEPKAREERMIALSANDMARSIDADGRVALYGIFFDTGKADIKPESKASLDQIGELMKQRTDLKLHVVGHTDNVGGVDSNMALSKRRAESVVAALTSNYGVNRARLTGNGVASLAPVKSNTTEEGRAKNRRVELVLQ